MGGMVVSGYAYLSLLRFLKDFVGLDRARKREGKGII